MSFIQRQVVGKFIFDALKVVFLCGVIGSVNRLMDKSCDRSSIEGVGSTVEVG